MQFYFIRHGESSNNALYAQTGSSLGRSADPELTEKGRQQALHLGRYLAGLSDTGGGLTHLYCSLMVRSVDTALTVSAAIGVPAVAWVDLHEGGGIYLDKPAAEGDGNSPLREGLPGKTRREFQLLYPDLVLPLELDGRGWWNRPFEESSQRPARAHRVVQELLRRHAASHPDGSEDRVAVISHGGFYNHFLRALFGLPARSDEEEDLGVWFSLNNTGITRIDIQAGRLLVRYQNRTHFLPDGLLT